MEQYLQKIIPTRYFFTTQLFISPPTFATYETAKHHLYNWCGSWYWYFDCFPSLHRPFLFCCLFCRFWNFYINYVLRPFLLIGNLCVLQVSALILENTFTSILDMAGIMLPFLKWFIGGSASKGPKVLNCLVRSPWSTIDAIGEVSQQPY